VEGDDLERRSPYHAAERAIQARLGVRERAEQIGRKVIRDSMPDQHRELFRQLPFVLLATLTSEGQPWPSLLSGAPGFMQSPDPRTLSLRALPAVDDPANAALALNARVGLLGIHLETRRRNRMNGRVGTRDDQGFSVRVEQSFGNCPQYIQARAPAAQPRVGAPATPEGALLSAAAASLIRASDTCFLASAFSPHDTGERSEGVDVSHRGGRPGFVSVQSTGGRSVLTLPDFAGNNAFNTLGNLVHYPRAGVLFADFARGDVLTLAAEAEIVWDGPEVAAFAGARRLLRLRVREGLWFREALPFVWSEAEQAPQLARTGTFTPSAQGTSSDPESPM
jgi:uncharacterized protein